MIYNDAKYKELLKEYFQEGSDVLEKTIKGEIEECLPVEEEENQLTRVPLDCIPVDLPLPCPLYAKVGDKFVMFRRQADKISQRRVMALQEKKVGVIYIHKSFWSFFLKKLEELELPPDLSPELKIRHIRTILLAYGEQLEKITKTPKKTIFEKLKKTSFVLGQEIFYDRLTAIKGIFKNICPDTYFVNHSVNSATLCALIGKSIGYSLYDVQLITYAALVHDVGNIFVPKRILYKPDKLTDEEWNTIKAHPIKGAELLQAIGEPPQVALVALQHHERANGQGYPNGLTGDKIHPFAKVVAIADVFDAIISARPHRGAEGVDEAIRKMTGQEGLFDPVYLSTMFSKLK